ncbi:MAG: hypothetical protein RLZZ454_879, partial [Pseudomonadota bacterium]
DYYGESACVGWGLDTTGFSSYLGLGCLPVVERVAHAYGQLRSSARQIPR